MSNFLYGANVHANGIRQHYLRYGGTRADRDPIILLPGITSPAITWGFVGEQLRPRTSTSMFSISVDAACQRRRPPSTTAWMRRPRMSPRSQKHSASSRYAIVGHSMGARIAIRAARSRSFRPDAHRADRPAGVGPRPTALPRKSRLVRRLDGGSRATAPASMPCAPSARPGQTSNCACAPNGCTPAMNERCWRALTVFTPTIFMPTCRMSAVPTRLIVAGARRRRHGCRCCRNQRAAPRYRGHART